MIDTVLCPTDLSDLAERELRTAAELCTRFGARLVVEHNVDQRPPPGLGIGWMWSNHLENEEHERAAEARSRLGQLFRTLPNSVPVEAKLTRGPAAHAVLRLAEELPSDVIVTSDYGETATEHDSVTEQIASRALCSVIATHGEPLCLADDRELLVAVDFSRASKAALERAFAIAERIPVRLVLLHLKTLADDVHAITSGGRRPPETALASIVPAALSSRTETLVERGVLADEVTERARSGRLAAVLVGLHPRGVLSRRLSSTTRELLRRSPRPVWLVPARG